MLFDDMPLEIWEHLTSTADRLEEFKKKEKAADAESERKSEVEKNFKRVSEQRLLESDEHLKELAAFANGDTV